MPKPEDLGSKTIYHCMTIYFSLAPNFLTISVSLHLIDTTQYIHIDTENLFTKTDTINPNQKLNMLYIAKPSAIWAVLHHWSCNWPWPFVELISYKSMVFIVL